MNSTSARKTFPLRDKQRGKVWLSPLCLGHSVIRLCIADFSLSFPISTVGFNYGSGHVRKLILSTLRHQQGREQNCKPSSWRDRRLTGQQRQSCPPLLGARLVVRLNAGAQRRNLLSSGCAADDTDCLTATTPSPIAK